MTNMHAALKQLALAAALGAFVVASPAAFADGKGQHKHGHKHQSDKHYYKDRDKAYKDYRKHVRKAQREDAKAHRRWARGQYIPRDYIVERYYVRDYRSYRLAPPPQGYMWVRPYQDDNTYYMVQLATGLISQIFN